MEPKLCVKHLKHCEMKLQGRVWKCPACYNKRRRERYAEKKDDPKRKELAASWRNRLRPKMREWRESYNEKLKRSAFDAYGGARCKMCGEDKIDRLALDHIDNNGHADRSATKRSGTKLYSFLKTHDWPPGFQVLCHNCNILKRAARYLECAKTRKQQATLARAKWIKTQVVVHYGGGFAACVKCGYDKLEALTLDHVNNNGYATRGVLSPGRTTYLKLMNNGYPPGYQTLCFCCNMEKEIMLRR